MQNNFRKFGELVFCNLWFPVSDSEFRIPVSDSGFRIPDSGFRFHIPVSGFRFPGFRVALAIVWQKRLQERGSTG